MIAMLLLLLVALALTSSAGIAKPEIRKLGTIDCDIVETTPIVFKRKLYRFEYIRHNYKPNKTGASYFRFIDIATGKPTPSFAAGRHLGSAHVEGDTVYVFGVNDWGKSTMYVYWSKDMKNWDSKVALDLPGYGMFNNSVCKGPNGYIMAIELDKPKEEVGHPFTMRFAESPDLINWKLTPSDCVYTKDRYSSCPTIRFLDGNYYMIYCEERHQEREPRLTWEPHIVRSPDLVHWERSPLNPVMQYSDEDKRIANPKLTAEQREHIAKSRNLNDCDVDLCEFKGKTVINYCWGNQAGTEFLAEAVYEGSMESFLKGWFPAKPEIKKIGTVECDLAEATPIVFHDKLYRFEYIHQEYKTNTTGQCYFRFVNVESGRATPSFGHGYHLGSAHVEGDTVYVYGVKEWGGPRMYMWWSKDLKTWESKLVLDLPGYGMFNNSVCKGPNGYIMAIELDKPKEEVGVPFTTRFAESRDLMNWKLTPSDWVFTKERYSSCPTIRFVDGYYYMVYCEEKRHQEKPRMTWEPYIVRSRDLINWETSPLNPVLQYSDDDRKIANPKLTPAEREHIAKAVNLNNCDADLCEFDGKTIITYGWGNQNGVCFMCEAVHEGSLESFLKGWFAQ